MSGNQKKSKMTDAERQKLAEKLDKDLEEFIKEKQAASAESRKNNPDPYADLSIDELAEKLMQHPAFIKEIDPSKPLSAEMEGLIALKYDTNDAEEKALNYKEDGNQNFKVKKYKWAMDSYTEGIKAMCPNKELNAILYTNRAAAQYHIGNYRSAFQDCLIARKFKPDHIKAIIRGVQCCVERTKHDMAIRWCDDGLVLDPKEKKLLELRTKATQLKRAKEKEERKYAALERTAHKEEDKLLSAIKKRKIRLEGIKNVDESSEKQNPLILSSLETHHPSGAKVHLNADDTLSWPVMFLYPEYMETDFISEFRENSSFADHLQKMFSVTELPSWDAERKYLPHQIQIYFENRDEEKLYKIDEQSSLLSAISHPGYLVQGGTPGFILLVKDSPFAITFLKRYKI